MQADQLFDAIDRLQQTVKRLQSNLDRLSHCSRLQRFQTDAPLCLDHTRREKSNVRTNATIRTACLAVTLLLCGTVHAIEFECNGLVIGVNDSTGGICRLFHPATGDLLRAPPESAGLLDVAYPLKAFEPLRLGTQHSVARILREDGGLRISYERLGPSRTNVSLPTGAVAAEITLKPASDGRSVVLACRIDNQSEGSVPQILFPDLHGFQAVEGPEHTRLRFGLKAVTPFLQPFEGPGFAPVFYVDRGWQAYPPSNYYGINCLRWLDYGGFKGGISVFQRKWGTPDWPTVRTQRRESEPGSLRLLWEHSQRVEPKGQWESGEFWLTPHAGGWAKGIEVFRSYVKEVNTTSPMPQHVREGLGFRTAWMMQAIENDPAKAAFRFSDIPRLAADAKEHGLDELSLWGYCRYAALPIELRDELGTREEFLAGISEARKLGVNVAPFVSVQLVRNVHAQRYGLQPGNANWTYHPELIPNFTPYYSDAGNGVAVPTENAVWRQDVTAALTQWIDAGVPSFCWDVLAMNASADGKCPTVELLRPIREKARAKQASATISGEPASPGAFEFTSAIIDYTWNWVDYLEAGPVLNVLRNPRLNCHVEDGTRAAKLAFADGLYLNVMPRKPDQPNGTALISEHPELARALKQLTSFRRKFLPYFVDGVFLGDSILNNPSSVHVAAHQLDNRLLVILLNDTSETKTASLEVPLDLWFGGRKRFHITEYDSMAQLRDEPTTVSDGKWTCITQPLGPLEFAFYEVEIGDGT